MNISSQHNINVITKLLYYYIIIEYQGNGIACYETCLSCSVTFAAVVVFATLISCCSLLFLLKSKLLLIKKTFKI